MIVLLKDVAGYRVGDRIFEQYDEAGQPSSDYPRAYSRAWKLSQQTGERIEVIGPRSVWNPNERAWKTFTGKEQE